VVALQLLQELGGDVTSPVAKVVQDWLQHCSQASSSSTPAAAAKRANSDTIQTISRSSCSC